MIRSLAASLLFAVTLSGCVTAPADLSATPAPPVAATGAVSAADPRAEEAGYEMLRAGGNATDAAIATMLALTVVEPQSSGIGGGGFLVRGTADGTVVTYDGRETAPAGATPDWFLNTDGTLPSFSESVRSGLSVGVPGNIALAAKAHSEHGTLPWARLFDPAIRLARWPITAKRRGCGVPSPVLRSMSPMPRCSLPPLPCRPGRWIRPWRWPRRPFPWRGGIRTHRFCRHFSR